MAPSQSKRCSRRIGCRAGASLFFHTSGEHQQSAQLGAGYLRDLDIRFRVFSPEYGDRHDGGPLARNHHLADRINRIHFRLNLQLCLQGHQLTFHQPAVQAGDENGNVG